MTIAVAISLGAAMFLMGSAGEILNGLVWGTLIMAWISGFCAGVGE